MIVHELQKTRYDGNIRLSAQIEFDTQNLNLPDRLWFEVPERCDPMLTDRSEAFLTALIQLPMLFREPVHFRGLLSPKLHYGLQMVQRALNFFLPRELHIVDIHADHLVEMQLEAVQGRGVSTLFSGGADSLHTIWSHMPERQPLPEFRITHALFVDGFDLWMKRKVERFERLFNQYRALLRNYEIDLIPIRTNLRAFTDPPLRKLSSRNDFGYSAGFPAVAMLFSKHFRIHYIPSSLDFSILRPYGTHPGTDYYYATETLSVYHDGSDRSRTEKFDDIVNWEEGLDVLRVCNLGSRSGSDLNCGRCVKCTRTMVRLSLLDVLDRVPTFTSTLTAHQIYRTGWRQPHVDAPFFPDMLRRAAAKRRWGLYTHLLGGNLLKKISLFRHKYPYVHHRHQRPPGS